MSLELQQAIQSYENYISDNGIDESVIDAMIEACKVAYQTEKDIPYALKVSARTKEIIENFVLNLTGTDIWGLEKYSFENKVKYEIIDRFYEVLLLEAQNKIVDSGFRYLERKREPKERFYMPRRKQFLKIGLVDALQGMIDDKYDILCISLIQNMYAGNPRVKVIAVPDIDPVTGESNFEYEYSGFKKEFFADQQLLMDDISYRCLYKQEPIEREGLLFPDDKIRRYLHLPHGEPEIITAQCDTKGKGTDYFVMPVLQKYGEDYYCVDAVCDNTADYEMQYENASNAIVNNQVQECEFERNAGGDRVAMEVNKRVEQKGWVCNITDVPTETNKEARIFQCSNWILQHVIFKDSSLYKLNEPYGVMMSLLKQYSVSGKKQLDDVPDVFSNFAIRMTKGNRVAKAEAIHNPFRGGYGHGY